MHQEPDVGLDPGTPGSLPGPKADAKLLSHPGVPGTIFNLRDGLQCSLHKTLLDNLPSSFGHHQEQLVWKIFRFVPVCNSLEELLELSSHLKQR